MASDLGRGARDDGAARLIVGLQLEMRGLRHEVEDHKREIDELRRDMRDVRDIANRWRGGFAVVVGAGALLGWLLTQVDKIRSWLH